MSIFISYSHRDEGTLERMLTHLKPLTRERGIDVWSDKRLKVSDRWRKEIRNAIDNCTAAVLLISADFYGSDFIVNDELKPLLARESRGECAIFCVLVGPSQFQQDEVLSEFHATPGPESTLIEMDKPTRERTLRDFATKLAKHYSVTIRGGGAIRPASEPDLKDYPLLSSPQLVFRDESVVMFDVYRSGADLYHFGHEAYEAMFMLQNRVFENCKILGPAVLFPYHGCSFVGCQFEVIGGDVGALIIKSRGSGFMGALGLVNCRFTDCELISIGFTAPESTLRMMREAIAKSALSV
jgi:hypothetical protein